MLPQCLLTFLSLSAHVNAQSSITVTIPSTSPSNAVTASSSLLGFSIEGDRWPDWVALAPSYTSANTFTSNALGNIGAKTGLNPDVRVGANSEDRILFNPSVTIEQASFPPPTSSLPYPEATAITVGNGYYALARFLPQGTHVTWGVNFGTTNTTPAIAEAQSILSAFGSASVSGRGIVLDLLELGNEPDLYGTNGHRASSYNIATYVSEWETAMGAIISATGLTAGGRPAILGLSFGHSDHGAGSWSPQQAFKDGLLSSNAGSLITVVSQHGYEGGCCTALISDLMSKSLIRSNLTVFSPDIAAVKAQGRKYIMGETNSYFNHGVPNVSDAAGAAIWLVDYTLFAGTLGMSNVFFHEGIGFKYNLIQPIALNRSTEDGTPISPPVAAHVQAPYYGAIVLADFLGNVASRTLVEIPINNAQLSGYAVYGAGTLQRVLLVNHQAWLSTSSGSRPTIGVTLQLSGGGNPTVSVKRLAVPFADSKTGLRWGGQSYETADALVSGTLTTSSQGLGAPVVVSASEVVMISF